MFTATAASVRRSGPTILMVGVLLGASVVALGAPQPVAAGRFLSGADTSDAGVVAVVALITWILIAVAVTVVVTNAFRGVASQAQFVRRSWTRAIFFAVVGAVLLGVGVMHHTATGYSMCCGSVQEAQQTLAK